MVVLYPLIYVLSASFSSIRAVFGGRVWPVEPTLVNASPRRWPHAPQRGPSRLRRCNGPTMGAVSAASKHGLGGAGAAGRQFGRRGRYAPSAR